MNTEPRVLIVDDDAPTRRALARLLRGEGWLADTAADPDEAINYLCERVIAGDGPLVVLSDWDMPNGGGARVLAESPVPVVIYTGNPDAPPAGTRVLTKPAELNVINAALRAAIGGR